MQKESAEIPLVSHVLILSGPTFWVFFFLNIHILLIPLKCIFFLDEDFFRKFLEVDQIHKRDQMTFFSILSCPANSVCYSLHLQSSGHLVKTTRFLCSSYICLQ